MVRPREGWELREPRQGKGPNYTVRFTDRAGSQREFSTGESDPGKAAERAAEIYARDLTAAPQSGPRISPHLALDEHMSQWLASLETTHDPETVVTYTAHARRFIAFFGSSISRITVPRMGDYQRKRLGEVTRLTVRKERSTLNGFLTWCEEQGLISEEHRPHWPRLPQKALGVRSGPQREAPVDLTPSQVNAFLAALPQWSRARKGEPAFAIRARFIVAYETGLRPALLDALSMPEHWRPGATEILIEKQHDKARFGRKVPISARCAEALERTVLAIGLTSGLIFGEHDYRWAVDKAAASVGLPENFAPYDLRHGRAGHLLDAGATLRAVAHLLGHRKLTTTDRYLRAQEGGARAALDAASSRGESGDEGPRDQGTDFPEEVTMRDDCAKEGGRTPTVSLPLVPETGETEPVTSSYEGLTGQEGTQKDSEGQGSRGTPKTDEANPLAASARFLAVLRAQWDALEAAVAGESFQGTADDDDDFVGIPARTSGGAP